MALLTLQLLKLPMSFEPCQIRPSLFYISCLEDGRCVGWVPFISAPFPIKKVFRADPGPLIRLPGLGRIIWVLSLHSRYPELPLLRIFSREGEKLDPGAPVASILTSGDTAIVYHFRI